MHVIIPAYKRPDFLRKCLNSVFQFSRNSDCRVMVFDDCSPGKEIRRVCNDFPVIYTRFDQNVGPARAIAVGLSHSVVMEEHVDRFLIASDHYLPKGWFEAVQEACKVARKVGAEVGAFDHYPGPLEAQEKWHKDGRSLTKKARIAFPSKFFLTCSMPSIVCSSAPVISELVNHLLSFHQNGQRSNCIRDAYTGFWKRRCFKRRCPMFAVTGLMLHHMGHSTSSHFVRNEEHMSYYKEQGRLDWVMGKDPARP